MGAWTFIESNTWRIKERGYDIEHIARVESGSPATGSKTVHDQELADLLDRTFSYGGPIRPLAALPSSVVAQRQLDGQFTISRRCGRRSFAQRQLRPPRLASWRTDLAEEEDFSLAEVELQDGFEVGDRLFGVDDLMVVMPMAAAGLRLMPRSSRKTHSPGSTASSSQAIS